MLWDCTPGAHGEIGSAQKFVVLEMEMLKSLGNAAIFSLFEYSSRDIDSP